MHRSHATAIGVVRVSPTADDASRIRPTLLAAGAREAAAFGRTASVLPYRASLRVNWQLNLFSTPVVFKRTASGSPELDEF